MNKEERYFYEKENDCYCIYENKVGHVCAAADIEEHVKGLVDLLNQYNSKTIELEEKLSEKEEKIKVMETLLVKVNEAGKQEFFKCLAMLGKNRQLEQKLLEKEKEADDSKQCSIDYQNDNTMLEQEINHLKSILDLEVAYRNKLLKTSHQDKILFCIERLEKVKEIIFDIDKYNCVKGKSVVDYIDNQIEELKKDKGNE